MKHCVTTFSSRVDAEVIPNIHTAPVLHRYGGAGWFSFRLCSTCKDDCLKSTGFGWQMQNPIMSITIKLDMCHMTELWPPWQPHNRFIHTLAFFFFLLHCKINLYGFLLFSVPLNMVMKPTNIPLAAGFWRPWDCKKQQRVEIYESTRVVSRSALFIETEKKPSSLHPAILRVLTDPTWQSDQSGSGERRPVTQDPSSASRRREREK